MPAERPNPTKFLRDVVGRDEGTDPVTDLPFEAHGVPVGAEPPGLAGSSG